MTKRQFDALTQRNYGGDMPLGLCLVYRNDTRLKGDELPNDMLLQRMRLKEWFALPMPGGLANEVTG